MSKNETFFSSGMDLDPDYMAIRDSSLPQLNSCKLFVECLWQEYKPYCDTNFLSDARNHFHQRFWEMYLCVTMLKRGSTIEKAGSEGPEFSITINGRRFWLEAIAPEAGTTDDRVPELVMGQANSVHTGKMLMRYTAALKEKLNKYQESRKKGIIAEGDGYIIAISGSKIPSARFGKYLNVPFIAQALLGIGELTIAINPQTGTKVGEYYGRRDEVRNKNDAPISTRPFLDPAYNGISAIIHSTADVARYACDGIIWGEDFEVLHNPLATACLPFDALNWCKYLYVGDGELKTVERTPHEYTESPVKNLQGLMQNNPEFRKDSRAWARCEALKVLREFRSGK